MSTWGEVLLEIQTLQQAHSARAKGAVDSIRRKYLQQLSAYTNRNTIAYYSGFLSKPEIDSEINDEDKNGILMMVHRLDRAKGLDLILHTPGGGIAATQSIVNYLHTMFNKDVRAIVPQIAMSAGTIIACCCKQIVMTKHSNLGPIDPHLRGVPARGVIGEFKRACKEVKKDKSKIPIWQTILGQYRPAFLGQCENAIKWSDNFVRQQLAEVMFQGQTNARQKAARIVRRLANYSANKTHDRHIHVDDCEDMGLNILRAESDQQFQDLLLTVHHCYMHTLMNTGAFKIIENQNGVTFVKQQQLVAVPR